MTPVFIDCYTAPGCRSLKLLLLLLLPASLSLTFGIRGVQA